MGASRPGASGSFPYRLVCGIAVYTDPDHLYHPDEKDPVHSEPGKQIAHLRIARNRSGRRVPALLPTGGFPRICAPAMVILVVAAGDVDHLCHPDPDRQNLVLPKVRRLSYD